MNIVVTGSHGFIGRHLVEALSPAHHVIAVASRKYPNHDGLCADLTSKSGLQGLLKDLKETSVDAVIHLGAKMCSPDQAEDMALLKDNLEMTEHMIELAKAVQPAIFIHASSIAVYPNSDGVYSEDSAVDMSGNGDCLYGLAKFNAEMLFNFFLSKEMTVVNLRISQVFGPGMRPDRIIPSLAKEMAVDSAVTLFGEGQRVTNFVHVDDVIGAFVKVLESPKMGTFNIAHAKHYNLEQIANRLVKDFGHKNIEIKKVSKGSKVKQKINVSKSAKEYGLENTRLDFSGITLEQG